MPGALGRWSHIDQLISSDQKFVTQIKKSQNSLLATNLLNFLNQNFFTQKKKNPPYFSNSD